MASVTCECPAPSGFTNLGNIDSYQWWVHASCGRPTEPWLRAQGEDVLNFFKGGPLDGKAYSTSALLDATDPGHVAWVTQLLEYQWTPDVVVSPKTGMSARVWLHSSLAPVLQVNETAQAPVSASAAAGPPSPASSEEGNEMAAKKKTEAAPTGTLEDRRKTGGFSRNQVADKAGLSVAVVYRVEKGVSGKTTAEETAAVTSALDALEAANAS